MIRLLLAVTLLAISLTGCSQNRFNVPVENFAEKVRILGVAPIMVDTDSDIRHPQKEQLIQLLTELNRKNEQLLVRKLKATGNFYTIALLDSEPQATLNQLLFRRERRDDASVVYNKYFWKNSELQEVIRKNNLDAVMLLVISGLTKSDKVTSYTQFSALTSDYNFLTLTAQIVNADGTVLWEYPNFRQILLSYDPILNLEYPDFNEAEANLSAKANVKFKTIDGIKRVLEQKRVDWLLRETQEPEIYGRQFDAMVSLLKYDPSLEKKVPVPVVDPGRAAAAPQIMEQPAVPAAAPAAPARVSQPVEVPVITRVPVLEKPAVSPAPSNEIVPATGSTL